MTTNSFTIVFYRNRKGEVFVENKSQYHPDELDMVYIAVAFLLRISWLNLTDDTGLIRNTILDEMYRWESRKEIPDSWRSYKYPANRKFTLDGGIGSFVKVKFPFMMFPDHITNAALDFARHTYKMVSVPMKSLMIELMSSFCHDTDEQDPSALGLAIIRNRLNYTLEKCLKKTEDAKESVLSTKQQQPWDLLEVDEKKVIILQERLKALREKQREEAENKHLP